MYIRNIFYPIKYPYKLPSYALYRQELNIYKKMLNPVSKSVHFEHFESEDDSDDESEDDSDESEDDMKKGNGEETTKRNWFVNIFYSFYYTVKYTGKYSYKLLKNAVIYTSSKTYIRACILGSCIGLGIYYFIN
jgi:hypothetical protein